MQREEQGAGIPEPSADVFVKVGLRHTVSRQYYLNNLATSIEWISADEKMKCFSSPGCSASCFCFHLDLS